MATYRESDNSWCFTIRVPDDMYQDIEVQPGRNTSAKTKQMIAEALALRKYLKDCLGGCSRRIFVYLLGLII